MSPLPGGHTHRPGSMGAGSLSEYVPMADTGCDVSPSCLKCPLPQCKFENPAYTPHQSEKHRLYAGVFAARLAGETVNGLAERFGVSGRTVSRIIAAKGVFGKPRTSEDESQLFSRVESDEMLVWGDDSADRTADGSVDAPSAERVESLNGSVLDGSMPKGPYRLSKSGHARPRTTRRPTAVKQRKPLPAYNQTHDVTFRGGATAVYQKACPRSGCTGDVQYQPGQLNCLQCGWVLYSPSQSRVMLDRSA